MKTIINSSLLISAICLASCGGKENKVPSTPAAEIDVNTVVGIGKVLPESGIVNLSVTQPSRVIKIHKQLGDVVAKGDILFEMEHEQELLRVDAGKASLNTAQQNLKANTYELEKAKLKLKELEQIFKTSQRLRNQGAETPRQVFLDSIAYQEQVKEVQQQQQSLQAQKASLQEKNISIKTEQSAANQQFYKALQAGTLIRFDITLGQVLTANSDFGELADPNNIEIEGEVDELYASSILPNQKVTISLVGQSQTIATGTIKTVGVGLQNKSILYETKGEGTDRRIRRFTVTINDGQERLLINQKVECKIAL